MDFSSRTDKFHTPYFPNLIDICIPVYRRSYASRSTQPFSLYENFSFASTSNYQRASSSSQFTIRRVNLTDCYVREHTYFFSFLSFGFSIALTHSLHSRLSFSIRSYRSARVLVFPPNEFFLYSRLLISRNFQQRCSISHIGILSMFRHMCNIRIQGVSKLRVLTFQPFDFCLIFNYEYF